MNKCCTPGEECRTQDENLRQRITDIYISIFFDGTGNNMYEQLNKAEKNRQELLEKVVPRNPSLTYSIPNLIIYDDMHNNEIKEINVDFEKNYGESNRLQKEQAEYDFHINGDNGRRGRKDSYNDNSGWSYSNVGVMRSLTRRHTDGCSSDDGIIGISYNLYIEGSGMNWDVGSDAVALGMGVKKQGVVGLVSKAVLFVQHFLDSNVDQGRKKEVKVHFAVFGFSRGSTCGRLFSFLAVNNYATYNNKKHIKNELSKYLPESFIKDGNIHFLEEYNKENISVDFLGLYDTVSSIGFLQKYDNSTNNGITNDFVLYKTEHNHKGDKRDVYVNKLHGTVAGDAVIINKATFVQSIGNAVNNTPLSDVLPPLLSVAFTALESSSAIVLKGLEKRDELFGDAKNNFHRYNVKNYGLDPYTNPNVKHTFQISAIDEYRENFALVDLGIDTRLSENHCTEIMMPGCHSDIGGGYMYNDEITKYTLRRNINNNNTLISCNVDPRSIENGCFKPICLHNLYELGWLTHDERDLEYIVKPWGASESKKAYLKEKRFKLEAKGKRIKVDDATEDTPGQTTYIYQDWKKIEFERFVKEGYSNIALKLMINRALGSHGLNGSSSTWPKRFLPFQENLPRRFDCNKDPILDYVKKKCKTAEIVEEGNRYWILCDAENYKNLRREYLHFTCTDELNPEQDVPDITKWGANIGNVLNWRRMNNAEYLLCRLIYRGNADEKDLHYMSEYRKDGIL